MTSGQFSTKRIVEAALLASDEPLTLDALRRLFEPDPGADILASSRRMAKISAILMAR